MKLAEVSAREVRFLRDTKPDIVKEFRQRFTRVSMIMDCIICEKCRLWGKIQTLGIGTALKILFALESPKRWRKLKLRPSEITALFNTFSRISESLDGLRTFREAEIQYNDNLMMLVFLAASSIFLLPWLFTRKDATAH